MSEPQKKLTIVQRVLALLNITEEGKIENFFMKQRSILTKDIKNLNKNLDTVRDQHNDYLEELNEQLADANVRVEEAYTSVKIENVATNEAANNFASDYWYAVEQAEAAVSQIEKSIKNQTEHFEKQVESINAQIKERQRRLDRIA
jgi:hypothetical protein